LLEFSSKKRAMAVRVVKYKGLEFRISYEILNGSQEEDIIFLHGWGSSKELMKTVFENNFKEKRHIYIDLIGFGASSQPKHQLNSFDYFEIISLFLEEISARKDVIVGHSFGGKIATLLKPTKLVLLSSAGIIVKKPFKTRLKIALAKTMKKVDIFSFTKHLVSPDGRNLSSAMYKTFKTVVNENFEEIFKNCKAKTYVIWGNEDRTTPIKMGQKIAGLIANSKLYGLHGDHFFFVGRGDIIEDILKN
jgi:non-heme chloroperoxidase